MVESVNINNSIDNIEEHGVEINVPPITPYFTPTELSELVEESDFLNEYSSAYPTGLYNFNYIDSMNKIKELYEDYIKNPTDILEEEILSLGWNPSVEPNVKNIKLAHDRIYKDIKERYNINIIDIHDMMVHEDVKIDKKNMKPIYVVLSYRGSKFENLINKIKHSRYSHAALSLDTNMNKLYSFGQDGFAVESLDYYIGRYKDSTLKILCIFIDNKSYQKIASTISYYIGKKNKTKYSFSGCIRTLTGEVTDDRYSLKMICSEFVDQLLKLANVSLSDKNSNLVIPNDFDLVNDSHNFYILYEGMCKDYNKKNVDKKVKALLANKSKEKKQLKLKEAIDIMSNYKDILLYKSISILEDNGNLILEELTDLLTPNPVISEVGLFLKFDKDGNAKIFINKDFQSLYNQSHKLLLEYDKNKNYEGMKEELCKLWYINTKIEKKLHSKFKKNKKELLDIRARVLNDFKKYLTKILSNESNFSFSEYYSNSKYYDSTVNIDKETLKWSGKLLKSIIW